MPNDLPNQSREIAELTRRLSEFTIDLAKEGREAIRATRERIERSRQILFGHDPESAEAQKADARIIEGALMGDIQDASAASPPRKTPPRAPWFNPLLNRRSTRE